MHRRLAWSLWFGSLLSILLAGCQTIEPHGPQQNVLIVPPQSNAPRELAKVMLPRYVIEPPDILTIDVIRTIPRSPYRLHATDALNIRVINLSIASAVYESYETDPLTVAALHAVQAGIVVVAAAGNNGVSPYWPR